MLKINFLINRITELSGGSKYDKYFIKALSDYYENEINIIEDNKFENINLGFDFLSYGFVYLKKLSYIFDCDILFVNSRLYTRFIPLILLNKLKGVNCKIILIHHHYNYMTHNGMLKKLHKFFEISFLKKADQIIIPNPYIVDLTKKHKEIKGDIILLESAFEKEDYEISDFDSKRVLFVGNIERRKGLLYGIKAFEIFLENNPKYYFDIVGNYNESDKYYNKLKDYIKTNNLGKYINFTGRIDQEKLDWYYRNSKIFLFPSLNEGYGWVLIEAMAHGLPVIAFNNTAIPYTVKDGFNGFLAKNYNFEELAYNMSKSIKNKRIYIELQNNAIKTYKKANKYEDLNKDMTKYFGKLLNNN